tara:strand:+ start:96 stop:431 length:336 start_codon:yes stop_codon:yes gene_type:complete
VGYVYVLLTWLIVSLVWGGIGVAVGPGIMMLIIGWIVGVFGCLYSFGERLYGGQSQLRWAGLIVFVVSFVVTLLVFPSLSLTLSGYLFLAVFILISSYLPLFLIRKYSFKF